MIHPIIDPAFALYGKIEQAHPARSEQFRNSYLSQGSNVCIYCFPYDTVWDYVDGMTILLIQDDDSQRLFYLDRSVTIYAGVSFGFYPLGSGSTIWGDATLFAKENQVACVIPDSAAPQLHNIDIFTLFRQIGRDGLYFRGERHPPIELVYVEKGTLHNYCEGRDVILHPTELLLFGPDQWHMQYADEEVHFLTISFLWENYDFSDWYNQVITTSSDMQRAIKVIIQEYAQSQPDREEFINAQLKLLLLQILRQPKQTDKNNKTSPAVQQMHHQIVNKALQIISAQIHSKLTVPSLAAAVNVSTSQLTNLFQAYLGVSPAKYISRIRLEESKILLSGRQMSIGEVASALGYSSIQHFSKQFHLSYGYTPSAYIKSLQLLPPDSTYDIERESNK